MKITAFNFSKRITDIVSTPYHCHSFICNYKYTQIQLERCFIQLFYFFSYCTVKFNPADCQGKKKLFL